MQDTKKIIASEIKRWLDRESQCAQLTTADLEEQTRIRLWGKWALLGEGAGLQVKRQLKFEPRNKKDTTEWQALPLISDDDGMKIDRAVSRLDHQDREIVCRLYQYLHTSVKVSEQMRISRQAVMQRRDIALAYIAGALINA